MIDSSCSCRPYAARTGAPVLTQRLRWLAFLHWRYPAEVVQSRLPAGLTVESFDGTAWVGLVPLLIDEVRVARLPALPWLSRFPQTNLRTYVRGPDGGTGVWFLSLDAARLAVVLGGRLGYGLLYFWSSMSVRRTGAELSYRFRRRWPGPGGAGGGIEVVLGGPRDHATLTPLDQFLIDRHRLYSALAGRLVVAELAHPPWPLRQVRLRQLRQDLVTAAGLPAPDHDPVLHGSDGVPVRLGRWRPVSDRSSDRSG